MKFDCARDGPLQIIIGFQRGIPIVSVSHQLALNMFLPFVHTAHCLLSLLQIDWLSEIFGLEY